MSDISISYSAELNAVYVQIMPEDTKVVRTNSRDVGNKVINVDLDENDEVIGVEII